MDDKASSSPAILCSDAERARAVETLRSAMVDGRITVEEFSRRVESAHAARTDHDLVALVADLPHVRASETLPAGRGSRRTALFSQLSVACSDLSPTGPGYRCLFGTLQLDLTAARLTGPEALVEVFNLFGTVSVARSRRARRHRRGRWAVRQPAGAGVAEHAPRPCSALPDPGHRARGHVVRALSRGSGRARPDALPLGLPGRLASGLRGASRWAGAATPSIAGGTKCTTARTPSVHSAVNTVDSARRRALGCRAMTVEVGSRPSSSGPCRDPRCRRADRRLGGAGGADHAPHRLRAGR